MVKSRASTSSLFRSSRPSISDNLGLGLATAETTPDFGRHHRPPPLDLSQSNPKLKSKSSQPLFSPSLPVTPGTPPTTFPLDPFSHPTTLPEPTTKSRPGSVAHTLNVQAQNQKGPQIVVASPSTSTIHYLFPSAPSATGVHLRAAEVGRSTSQRKKRQGDTFGRRKEEEPGVRTTRLASEPMLRESKTIGVESMRTLRRQPSLADIGSRGRGKENEDKKHKSLKSAHTDVKPTLDKFDISPPVPHSPKSIKSNRRRSHSLSSPRPAPSIPLPDVPYRARTPTPTLPSSPTAPNFGRPLGIEIGGVVSSSEYTNSPTAISFTNPFPIPYGGVQMERGTTKVGCGNGNVTAPEEVRRKARMSIIAETPTTTSETYSYTQPSLRLQRSLSLKSIKEAKSVRRRSQSVSTTSPLGMCIGIGDVGIDMSDKYTLAKIVPSPSRPNGLGLDVNLDDLGQREPQRKRIDLGGSDISLLASTMSRTNSSVGLGISNYSPISLPESLMEEAVDLTETGMRISTPTSYTTASSEYLHPQPTPVFSDVSTPHMTDSQMTSPNFTSPQPQTPYLESTPRLESPTMIYTPPGDHTTKYDVTAVKPSPRLYHSKSFTSDVSSRIGRSFSWRSKPGEGIEEQKEKRLSRSFSFATKTRSPIPNELVEPPVIKLVFPIPNPGPKVLKRQPSTGEIGHRWRPPTMFCSPDGAIDSLPTPPRKVTPSLSIPHTPQMSGSRVTSTTSSKSGFLSASSSFRGFTKGISKSISRTFHHEKSEGVKRADSALKARISSPLEADIPAFPTTNQLKRRPSEEFRHDVLVQAVSNSIEKGLCELAVERKEGRSSWSRSVGRTFGLRSSSYSKDSGVGSISKNDGLKPTDIGSSRTLKEIGKEESQLSVYSTASFLPYTIPIIPTAPTATSNPIQTGPPIHITHHSPPKPTSTPLKSSPLNTSSSPQLAPLPPSPPLLDLPAFPLVPSKTHTIYRPPTPPSPTRSPAQAAREEWAPQPLLGKLGSEAQTQGKEERVRKVMAWRDECGGKEISAGEEIMRGVFEEKEETGSGM